MSAIMVRQGGSVQLEQSNMCLVLNMAKIAKGEILCAAIEDMKHLFMMPRAEVRDDRKR